MKYNVECNIGGEWIILLYDVSRKDASQAIMLMRRADQSSKNVRMRIEKSGKIMKNHPAITEQEKLNKDNVRFAKMQADRDARDMDQIDRDNATKRIRFYEMMQATDLPS